MLIPDSTFLELKKKVGIRTTKAAKAKDFNLLGYGVFVTPNKFEGRPLASNLKEIRYCFFEIDDKDKQDQLEIINASPLKPSKIIESKNSYHVYFRIKGCCTPFEFSLIQHGLIEHFKSDVKIKNVNRLMRAPGFYHMKDPLDPFMVKMIEDNENKYTVKELKDSFPYTPKEKTPRPSGEASSLEEWLNSLDHEQALRELSGTIFVNFEKYRFRNNGNGTKQIIVNGESTSCFISPEKLIGASPGGPTVWQWLRYFGHSDAKIRRIIGDVYDV